MPHKKAKQSVRQGSRNEIGSDLPPQKSSLRNEPLPKSAARILNAQSIREEFRKRKSSDDREQNVGRSGKRQKADKIDAKGKTKLMLTIQPGESMQHFNRRVEDDLRPLVKSAMQIARSIERGSARQVSSQRTEKGEKKMSKQPEDEIRAAEDPHPHRSTHPVYPKEFALLNTSQPKRLNDIAQAPPEFKKLPRGASAFSSKKDVLSMAQKLLMEKEREKAIARYREMKTSRKKAEPIKP